MSNRSVHIFLEHKIYKEIFRIPKEDLFSRAVSNKIHEF